VHPQTLRIYERRGLIEPQRTGGGSRRYSDRDIQRLRRVIELTEEGLNLEGVKRVMELEEEIARLEAELERTRAAAREEVERVHRQYRREIVPVEPSLTPVPFRRGRT
jgi:MerR family transcriptional regulator/heat shock protein HspR